MKIRLLETLSLNQFWGGVIPNRASSQQGTMDGACGIYALFNALTIGGHISYAKLEKLWNTEPDKRTKLSKWQAKCGPKMLHGTEIEDIEKLLDALSPYLSKRKNRRELQPIIQKREHKSIGSQSASESTLKKIREHLEIRATPVIVGLSGGLHHWVVAVGFQIHMRDQDESLPSILTIDSLERVQPLHAWNGVLSMGYQNDRRLRYLTNQDTEGIKCSVDGAWALS